MHRPRGKGSPPDRLQRPLRAVRDSDRSSSPQLLCQQPCGLVGDAELVLQLTRRHSVGMGCHEIPDPADAGCGGLDPALARAVAEASARNYTPPGPDVDWFGQIRQLAAD